MDTTLSSEDFLDELRSEDTLKLLSQSLELAPEEIRKHLNTIRSKIKDNYAETSAGEYILEVDGASRNNPGPAGGGAVLRNSEGDIIEESAQYFGRSLTNNEAEYRALLHGLEIVPNDVQKLTVKMDSELAVEQINGNYKVNSPNLKPLYTSATEKLESIPEVSLQHIPRSENERADSLANRSIDDH